MKKLIEPLTQILISISGILMFFGGIVAIVATFFFPQLHWIFKGIVVSSIGILLYSSSKMFFMFLQVIEKTTELIEEIKFDRELEEDDYDDIYDDDNLPPFMTDKPYSAYPKSIVQHIVMDENSTPEDLKDKIAEAVNNAVNISRGIDVNAIKEINETNINEFHIDELNNKLKQFVEENDFEKAAIIRDEINKRNKKTGKSRKK